MPRPTIRQWLSRWFLVGFRSRRPNRSLFHGLFLETLETRLVPAIQNWTGPSGGDWDTAANWNKGVGPVPVAGDTAAFSTDIAILVTHTTASADNVADVTGSPSFSISAGSLTISDSATFASLDLSGNGAVIGNGTITVSSEFSLLGNSTLGGMGVTNISGTATVGTAELVGETLNNFGTVTNNSDSFGTFFPINSVVNNESDGIWNASGTVGTEVMQGSSTFNNFGTLTFNSSAGSGVFLLAAFNNGSTVDVNSGTLALQDGFGSTTAVDTGIFNVASGATLDFDAGTHNLNVGSTISGAGNFEVSGGTVNVAGYFDITGNVSINFTSHLSTPGNGDAVFSTSVNVVGDVTFSTLSLTGAGTLEGAATVTVNGAATWAGGTMAGTGVTDLFGSSTISAGAATGDNLDTRTLINFGTVTQTATLTLSNGAVIDNETTPRGGFPVWNLQNGSSLLGGGNQTFNNLGGTLLSSGPAGSTSDVSITFNDSGFVEVQSGTLSMDEGGDDIGTDTIAFGSTLVFNGGTYNLNVISFVMGSGNVTFNAGTVNVAGTFTPTGLITVTGNATANFTNTVDDTGSVTFSSFLLNSNGTLTGSATVTVIGAATWSGGTMSGPGFTDLLGHSTITGNDSIDTRTLNNFGTVLSDGATISLLNSPTFNNESGANWEVGGAQLGQFGATTGVFNNHGTLTKFLGNTANWSIAFNNSSVVDVEFNFLSLFNGGLDTGSFTIGAGGGLQFGTGTHNLTTTSSVLGSGQVVFASANASVTVAGTFQETGVIFANSGLVNFTNTVNGTGSATFTTFVLNGGTLTGASTITVTGPTTWASGTMSGVGETVLLGNTTFSNAGLGGDILDTRTLNNFGTVSNNVNVTLNNSAIINNENAATWSMLDGSSIDGSGTFNDLGTLTATGNSTIGITSFALPTNGTLSGGSTVIFAASTQFQWSGGTMSGSGVTILLGNSTFSGTTDTLARPTLNNFGAVTDTGGLLVFNAVINNESSATWTLQNNATIGGSSDTFNNAGALTMASGTNSTLDILLNNSGVITVNSGLLDLLGGGTETGSFTAVSGTTLEFSGGTYNFNTGSSLTGAGGLTLDFGTVANIVGGFTLTGPITILGGATVNFANTVNGSGSVTLASLNINNGALTGGAAITVSGPATLGSSTLSGTSNLILEGNSTFIAGSAINLDTRTLTNAGTVTDSGRLFLFNGAIVNNASGAIWNLENTSTIYANGVFNNVGTLQSTGNVSFSAPLNNSGTFDVQSGFVESFSNVTNAGTVTLASGTTFSFITFTQIAGLLDGGGVLAGNVLINGGVVSPGFSPGLLTINGNYTQNSSASLNIEIAGVTAGSQYDVLAVNGVAQLGGTLNVIPLNGFVPSLSTTFQFLTASSVSGTFATVNGLGINGSESFTITYAANSVSLGVMAITSPPTTGTLKLGTMTPAANGTATWTLYSNLTGSTAVTTFTFGLATDFPVVGDWNGAGFDSVGVVRTTTADVLQWTLDTNGDHAYDAGDSVYSFGLNTDAPVVGDWTGSGTTKIGIVRPEPNGAAQWSLDTEGTGVFSSADEVTTYGLATDKFGAGDWSGDGKDNLAVVRAGPGGTAEWILNTTGTGVYSASDTVYSFGLATDTFIVGDWNGAGKTEIGVMRPGPNGTMVVTLDTNGDGVFDAGDQVFTIPATVRGNYEFGNWQLFGSLATTDPPNATVPALQLNAAFQADVNLAINLWGQAGLNSAGLAQLHSLTYGVANLGGGTTALDNGNQIVLDATAAGNGWSEGPTTQAGQVDLVTALAHEMGYALGLGNSSNPSDVMFATLPTGVRLTPTAADVNALASV